MKRLRMKNKISLDYHRKCNYICPYCDFYEERAKQHNFNQCPPLEGWLQAWHRIYLKYGECDIEITGGEPFLYPNFVQLVKFLSRLHIVKVTTNMTGDIKTWVREIGPGRRVLCLPSRFHAKQISAHVTNTTIFVSLF